MPRLYEWLVTGLSDGDFSVTEGISGSVFTLVDRQRLKNWQTKFYEEIELAADLLLTPAEQGEAH
jgi:hypothetical protein